MAEISQEQLNRLLKYEEALQKQPELLRKVQQASADVQPSINGINQSITSLTGSAGSVSDVITNFKDKLSSPVFERIGETFSKNSEFIRNFGIDAALAFESFMNYIPKVQNLFGQMGQAGAEAGTKISESFSRVDDVLSSLKLGGLSKKLQNVFNLADQARDQQRAMLSVAATAGDLNSMYTDQNTKLKDLSDQSASFIEQTHNVANAVGMTSQRVSEFAMNLAQIPGALRENIELQGTTTTKMDALQASITVANAFGMEHSEMVEQLNFAYRNLNETGKDALEFVSQMALAAQDLELPMDVVRRFTEGTAESFKMMGDNAHSAIRILDRFEPALEASGLGPAAIEELVTSMTQGIKQMDLAQKAFISGATGGAGGLKGAFELDVLMREGKMDEVLRRTMEAMQNQFGGEPLTPEDVTERGASPEELLKQVKFLQDVAGVAGTEHEAFRILEAMQTGRATEETFKRETETGPAALRESIDKGNQIQEAHFTKLVQIANEIERWQKVAALSNLEWTQHLMGTEGGAAEGIRIAREEATARATGVGSIGPERGQRAGFEDVKRDAISGTKEVFVDTFGVLKTSMQDVVGALPPEMRRGVKDMLNKAEQKIEGMFGGGDVAEKVEEARAEERERYGPHSPFKPRGTPEENLIAKELGLTPAPPRGAREMLAPEHERAEREIRGERRAAHEEETRVQELNLNINIQDSVERIASKKVRVILRGKKEGAYSGASEEVDLE